MTKPADFMLGLLDFFGVLLPGIVATWLVLPHLPERMQEALRITSGEEASPLPWVLFLFASYALGHFVFMAGSNLDSEYDRWRKRTKPTDVPFQAANQLRERLTPKLVGGDFSTLKWARSYVGIHSPGARLEIDRYEATSKFFRSMVVIAVLLVLHFLLVDPNPGLVIAAIVVCALSFWRFCDQRWKMTELTYVTAVIVDATKKRKEEAEETADAEE